MQACTKHVKLISEVERSIFMKYEIRRVTENDYLDIHALNQQLGYEYDKDKVKERISNLLDAGTDIITVLEVEGKVVGYIHGIPYNTLYTDNQINMVAIVFSNSVEIDAKAKGELFFEFEKRVKKNGYHGIRLTADVERDLLHEFLVSNGFENKRDLKHYIKYF